MFNHVTRKVSFLGISKYQCCAYRCSVDVYIRTYTDQVTITVHKLKNARRLLLTQAPVTVIYSVFKIFSSLTFFALDNSYLSICLSACLPSSVLFLCIMTLSYFCLDWAWVIYLWRLLSRAKLVINWHDMVRSTQLSNSASPPYTRRYFQHFTTN